MKISKLAILSGFYLEFTKAYENGLGLTPQMGWNSWNIYGCNINETLVINAAEKMKDLGLQELGYEYIVMDDCFQLHERDNETNKIVADPEKFPNGIKHMADKIHDMGFKFGMYSSAGRYTCGGYPGSLHNEELDAQTFADWGVDYLKYDNCHSEGNNGNAQISYARYNKMAQALNATGRPIFYALCQWGEDDVWNWGPTTANSWRISGDIYDSFDRYDDRCPCESFVCLGLQGYKCSMTNILGKAIPLGQKAGPGNGWNDLDSLEVGNGGMTYDEYVSHFTLWAILKSPLVLGNDVTVMSEEDLGIVTNSEIIAVNQDLSSPAFRVWEKKVKGGSLNLFKSTLSDDSHIVTIFNSGDNEEDTTLEFKDIFIDTPSMKDKSFSAKDLWTNETSTFENEISTSVKSHSIKIWKLVEN